MSGVTPDMKSDHPQALFGQSMSAFQKGDFATAIEFGNRLLKVSGEAAPAVVWAVRLRLESKKWDEAIEIGSRRMDQSPGLCGLVGHAYEGLGDLEAAQRHFERACSEQPENSAWWMHNASTLSRLHRDFESMEALQRAVELSQSPDPEALLILAAQELGFGYPARAIETVERALALKPRIEGGHALVARSLMAMGEFAEAEKRWYLAVQAEPRNASLPLQRAIALVRHGQFDLGIEALKKMLDVQPRFVPALVQIVTAKRFTEDDRPLIDRMAAILEDESISNEDRIALRYALGKAHDNLKEYESAMLHFDAGNLIQYQAIEATGGFDREGYTANMSLRIKVYDRETTEKAAPNGNPTEGPIFVLGVIRSGTTLAEQILSAHPEVAGAGELNFWINSDLRLMDYQRESLNLVTLREAAEAYLRLLKGFAKDGAKRVVDKQPGNLILAGALHIAYPNARIIHMKRHPVDTAVSIWTTHIRTSTRFVNHKGNIAFAFHEHDRLMQHWRETIPSDRFLDVSYESLISDRERTTRQMLEFCGLTWSDSCLEPEKNKKLVITPSLWQVRQPVYRTSIDRWKNYEPWLGEFGQLLESTSS